MIEIKDNLDTLLMMTVCLQLYLLFILRHHPFPQTGFIRILKGVKHQFLMI
jgi:hypothetical protein